MKIEPPDPSLQDGVVLLRPWTDRDISAIAAACDEEEMARWLDQIPQPYTEKDAREYVVSTRRGWREGTAASFAIVDVESSQPVGSVSIHWLDREQHVAEVGYWVARKARRRGVASRAVRLVARWVLEECAIERLQLRADVLNKASEKVAEKAGFKREGVLRSSRFSVRQGRRVDFAIYSLLPAELKE